ncbi:MAG: hypothetical protein ACR65X_16425 [Methylocystis sp.]
MSEQIFEKGGLAGIEDIFRNPNEFKAYVFKVRGELLPWQRKWAEVEIDEQIKISGKTRVALFAGLRLKMIGRRHDQLMNSLGVRRSHTCMPSKHFGAVANIEEIRASALASAACPIDHVVPEDGRHDQLWPCRQRSKFVEGSQKIANVAPTMVSAREIAIGGVKNLPGPRLVTGFQLKPISTLDIRCIHAWGMGDSMTTDVSGIIAKADADGDNFLRRATPMRPMAVMARSEEIKQNGLC